MRFRVASWTQWSENLQHLRLHRPHRNPANRIHWKCRWTRFATHLTHTKLLKRLFLASLSSFKFSLNFSLSCTPFFSHRIAKHFKHLFSLVYYHHLHFITLALSCLSVSSFLYHFPPASSRPTPPLLHPLLQTLSAGCLQQYSNLFPIYSRFSRLKPLWWWDVSLSLYCSCVPPLTHS